MGILKRTKHLINTIRGLAIDMAAAIAPPTCEVCGRVLVEGETVICLDCSFKMPRCRIHLDPFNTIHRRMLRSVEIDRAAAYFYYVRQSPYTNLIMSAKYRSRPKIIEALATDFAREIAADGFFDSIDLIVPVAMHRLKRLRRGYNQTVHLARGISKVTGIKIATNLKASRLHSTQTRKNASERWAALRSAFRIDKPEELEGKHLLIVDDVITTGATITACCEAIARAATTSRISVLSIGLTNIDN